MDVDGTLSDLLIQQMLYEPGFLALECWVEQTERDRDSALTGVTVSGSTGITKILHETLEKSLVLGRLKAKVEGGGRG